MPSMLDPDPTWQMRLEPVFLHYAALLRSGNAEVGLGGRLVWTGELNENGCALMRASNVAGAASLGCTADPAALRHANRDGVADFLVTSLDEALRILKNEIRKQQTVSVGVSAAPESISEEMRDRGVLPDLIPPTEWGTAAELEWFVARGSQVVETRPLPAGWVFRAWRGASAEFDARAGAVLAADDHINRRWIRLSPRYLGPEARRVRSLACSLETAERLARALS